MVDIHHLSYTYPGNPGPTLKDLSFSIEKGSIFGFLGPSGAGKSTTQKVLTRLVTSYTGNALINGIELDRFGTEYFNLIGVCFELPNHYLKLTALENLQFFGSFYGKRTRNLKELLEMVGLHKDAGKRVEEFSKGMKMRLNFIRSLLHDPEILFLDEPTAGLDPVNARNIKNIIKNLKQQGKTIFLTTHNMNDADELCDQVAFITEGAIVAIDSPDNLKYNFGQHTLNVEYTVDGRIEIATFAVENLHLNQSFQEILRLNSIRKMQTREASLEEVFIRITGSGLS
jgi:fluoroquinolone transport system ATP-binding protein